MIFWEVLNGLVWMGLEFAPFGGFFFAFSFVFVWFSSFFCVFLRFSLGGSQKGGVQKCGFGRCSPVPKTGTRVHSDVLRYQERGYMRMFSGTKNRHEGTFAKTGILRNRPFVSFLRFSPRTRASNLLENREFHSDPVCTLAAQCEIPTLSRNALSRKYRRGGYRTHLPCFHLVFRKYR